MLTQRQLNRALLARQGLLEPFADPLPRVLERVGGIQAQYAPSMYIGLWSRMRAFDRADLTRALEERDVVQATLLRGTIHLVSREDYWPFYAGANESIRDGLDSAAGQVHTDDISMRVRLLRTALADGPLRQKEIDDVVSRDLRGVVTSRLPLLRIPPSGTWERRRADVYEDASRWLGPTEAVDVTDARALLVRRYLGGFGPSTAAEIASWAGRPVRVITAALEQVDHVEHAGEGGAVVVDLPNTTIPDPDTPAPVRFLPTWDATLLVHKRRTQILPEEHRPKIFSTKTPHSFPTFLVDGRVAGTWRHEKGHVQLNPFEPLSARRLRDVEQAADALARFHR